MHLEIGMARKPLVRSNFLPYHITARGNNREPFPCEFDQAWKVFSINLNDIITLFGVKIHAFVLMPNHFHLLLTTPADDLGLVMQHFMKSVTKTINMISGRSGRVFGGKYHWSLVDNDHYLDSALKYIYRNPVKAGLAMKVEEYAYSSIREFISHDTPFSILPSSYNSTLVPDGEVQNYLSWLNRPFNGEQEEAIRIGLKKRKFSPPKSGWRNKAVDLDIFRNGSTR